MRTLIIAILSTISLNGFGQTTPSTTGPFKKDQITKIWTLKELKYGVKTLTPTGVNMILEPEGKFRYRKDEGDWLFDGVNLVFRHDLDEFLDGVEDECIDALQRTSHATAILRIVSIDGNTMKIKMIVLHPGTGLDPSDSKQGDTVDMTFLGN